MAPWFGRKRLGLGAGPRTWQGWLLVAAVLLILGFGRTVSQGWLR